MVSLTPAFTVDDARSCVAFPCPQCRAERAGYDEPCGACGWAPKPGSVDAVLAERPAPRGPALGWRGAILALVAVVALFAIALGLEHWSLSPDGAPCSERRECRGHVCLGMPEGRHAVCSSPCDTDRDCDGEMFCHEARVLAAGVLDVGARAVCVPVDFDRDAP